MRPGLAVVRWATVLIASILMLLVGPAASASGEAGVRFVHAVPGAESAQLEAQYRGGSQPVGGLVAFGEVSAYSSIPAGRVTFRLSQPSGDGGPTVRERLQ